MADRAKKDEQDESHCPARKKAKEDSTAADKGHPATKTKRERRLRHQPKDVLEFSKEVEHAGMNVYNFAQARAEELKSMLKTTTSCATGKRVFQSLPRHMRRRAMSHNVKRLPRRLREAAKREMASQTTSSAEGSSKKKPPSRRARRRPRDLAKEYKKREDRCSWLETHIWHSKRMKMAAKWGFKLALKRAGKGVRAAYRSMKSECLLSDISYYCLIEVCGPQGDVLAVVDQLTSTDTGLTCGALSFLGGEREGRVLLYRTGQFPLGFIGPARILWRPLQGAQMNAEQVEAGQVSEAPPSRTLWLWLHPTTAEDAHRELQTASSSLSGVSVSVVKDQFAQFCLWGPRSLAVLASVLKPAKLQMADPQSTHKGPELVRLLVKEKEKDETSVVEELQWWKKLEPLQVDSLGRSHDSFARLQELDSSSQVPTGLVLGAVVCDPRLDTPAKRQHVAMGSTEGKGPGAEVEVGSTKGKGAGTEVEVSSTKDKVAGTEVEVSSTMGSTEGKGPGAEVEVSSTEKRPVCDAEVEVSDGRSGDEDKMEKEDVLPPTSLDGQVLLEGDAADISSKVPPSAQHDSLASVSSFKVLAACPLAPSPQLAYSPLWNSQLRMQASQSKVSNAILNKVRSTSLVRSAELQLGDMGCCVPVLLVHQDYQTTARANHNHYTSGWSLICPKQWGMPFFVNLVYRCAHVCGLQELQQAAFESGNLHFPTDYPDSPASKQEWEEEGCALEEAYARYPPAKRPNYGKLSIQSPFRLHWDGLFKQDAEGAADGFYVLRSQSALRALRAAVGPHPTTSESAAPEKLLTSNMHRGLVALDVTVLHKGCPQPRAMVCLPMASDLEQYKTDLQYSGPEEKVKPNGICVVEKGSVCIGQSQLCKKELKVAKQQWKKDVKKSNKDSASPAEGHVTSQPPVAVSLQLSETTPSRKVIGYITSGGFSQRLGCGRGVGLCSVSDLLMVVQQSRSSGLTPTVLIRNPNSRQYFAAQVAVH